MFIPLRARDGTILSYARIDDADAHLVENSRWSLDKDGYAVSGYPQRRMHRVICGLEKGDPRQPDHINRNRLDNRRSNLRIVELGQQQQNCSGRGRSGRRGVAWNTKYGLWQAGITVDGKYVYLGVFDDVDRAAAVASHHRRLHFPLATD